MPRSLIVITIIIFALASTRYLSGTRQTPTASSSGAIPSDIESLVKGPPHEAPAEYKKEFVEAVARHATPTTSVNVTGCLPQPIIAEVKLGSNIIIRNDGDSQITIELTQAHGNPTYIYHFDQKTVSNLKADFGKGLGAFAYYCNHSKDPVGIFYLN